MTHPIAAKCATAASYIPHIGVPSLSTIIGGVVALALGFGLGWYIKGRGMTGVQIDLSNIKTDVENLKNKVFPVATPAPVATVTN